MTTREVSNTEDVLDSRDIIARIEELESLRDEFVMNESETEDDSPSWGEIAEAQGTKEEEWDESEEGQELKILKNVASQCEGYGDWGYGETLIRDSYFQEYAEDLANELGYMDNESANRWPFTCIDWERATQELQQDYASVDFDGIDYWIRA